MGKYQRERGKRGERLLVQLLKDHGFTARRGVQFSGGPDSPDVVSTDLPFIHFECKFVERLSMPQALNQAQIDAGQSKLPIVAWKRNKQNFFFTLKGSDFLDILTFALRAGYSFPPVISKAVDKLQIKEENTGHD